MNHVINPIVYILIERVERELDSKLLTALRLLKKGFHVMLGHQWALTENRDCLPTGIFFFKGMNEIHSQWMAKVRQFDHVVVAMEEEQLDECISPPDFYFNYLFDIIYSKDTRHHCQLLLAKHESEAKIIKQVMPELTVRLTGSPRTDFLRQELVTAYYSVRDEISRRVSSKFVLINTNTGYINSNLTANQLLELYKKVSPRLSSIGDEWIERHKEQMDIRSKWEKYNLRSICKLVELFGRCSPNQKIIIRPHPSESLDIYGRLSNKYPNIEVASNQESARPWILASDILIHTGCTTGAEAVAMNHPAISIQEKGSEDIRFRASNNVSYLTHTAEEAFQSVQDFYAGKLELGNTSRLKELWPAQEGEFAAERIADEIYDFYLGFGGLSDDFELTLSGKFKQVKLTDFYKQKMFVELPQIERILAQIYQRLPDMPQVRLYEISRNVFYMRPS